MTTATVLPSLNFQAVTGPKAGTVHFIETGGSGKTLGCAMPPPLAGWTALTEVDPQRVCARCAAVVERRIADAAQQDVVAEAEKALPNGIEAVLNGGTVTYPTQVVADAPITYTAQLTDVSPLPSQVTPLTEALAPVPTKETLAQRRARQVAERGDAPVGNCLVCGKPLKWEESNFRGMGPLCYQRVLSFMATQQPEATPEELDKSLKTCSQEELEVLVKATRDVTSFDTLALPDEDQLDPAKKYLTTPQMVTLLKEQGKRIGSFVRAIGGDRGRGTILASHWRPYYYNGKRWISREALDHFDDLADVTPKAPAAPVAGASEGARS